MNPRINQLDPDLQFHDIDHDSFSSPPSRLFINPKDYPGGIAFWGALPAVFDTANFPDEEGVHVHARKEEGGPKQIDQTFYEVEIPLPDGNGTFLINGRHGVAYNIATILHRRLSVIKCPTCQTVHFDDGFDSVNYHCDHTCEHCGFSWTSDEPLISNPLMLLKHIVGDEQQHRRILDPVERRFVSQQSKWKGGIQFWGSNPALIWTSPKAEEGGIHVHACLRPDTINADETFGEVIIDDLKLDPEEVRHLMAQMGLPYLWEAVQTLSCPHCLYPHFDKFGMAIVPHISHHCLSCGKTFESKVAVVSNPALDMIRVLYENHRVLVEQSTIPDPCKKCLSRLSRVSL